MENLISVIVPVYNVENYLGKCVSSILVQSYPNIEVILVDDGSTDDSGALCDTYQQQMPSLKVIHKLNGGLSDARNAGLQVASGEFICFVDSDDWMERDILRDAYDTMVQTQADVVIWGFQKDFVDSTETVKNSVSVSIGRATCNREEKRYHALLSQDAMAMVGYAWNKLYRRELIENKQTRFLKGVSLVEDMLFNSAVLSRANKIEFIEQIGTHYIQRERETLGARFYSDFFELKIQACHARENLLYAYGAQPDEVDNIMGESYFSAIKSACRMACRCPTLSWSEKMQYMRELASNHQAKKILRGGGRYTKDKIFQWLLNSRQYWLLELMYRL